MHLSAVGQTEPNGDQKKRAITTWRLPGYQPGIVEFKNNDEIAFVKFETGGVDFLKYDGNGMTQHSNILLAHVQ
jgi:hypothetical protein